MNIASYFQPDVLVGGFHLNKQENEETLAEIADLLLYAPNFLQSQFDQMTIPKQGTYGFVSGNPGFAVDYEVNAQILREFLYGSEETEE